MYNGLHVKYPLYLSDFNETWIFSIDFRRISKYQNVQWEPNCSVLTDWRTDKRLLIPFHNILKAFKQVWMKNDTAQNVSESYWDTYIVAIRCKNDINVLKPTGHVMHQQFNIQQLYVLPTLYLCVLYSSENKQRLVPLTA